jgi:hypothetical protein
LSAWLVEREQAFGGKQRAPRRSVSPHDPRTPEQIAKGHMIGGDRMQLHGYAPAYAEELLVFTKEWLRETELKYTGGRNNRIAYRNQSPIEHARVRGGPDGHRMQPREERGHDYAPLYARAFNHFAEINKKRLVLVELGILRGNGLAIWCDLFPHARVIGLDVDLTHWKENEPALKARGAFQHNLPETYHFDELDPLGHLLLKEILGEDKIDVLIDDALHDTPSIMKAMRTMLQFMARPSLYFIEDNRKVHREVKKKYGRFARVKAAGEMTVVRL